MLIVEGPDGSGKTTLITQLEERLGVTREPKSVSSDAEVIIQQDQWSIDQIEKGFGRRIYDRFNLISGPFYCMLPNPTFKGKLRDPEWLMETWIRFRQLGPMIVVCLPPLEVVLDNVMNDESNKVVQKDIETIYWLYHNFAAQYPWVAMVYDYTQHSFEDLNHVLNIFEARLDREGT